MEIALSKLKKVPVASKQELLVYISNLSSPVVVKISLISCAVYYGYVVSSGLTKSSEQVVVFQIINERNGFAEGMMHLSTMHIVSVEIPDANEAVKIFSLGTVASNPAYDISGKLDVQRAFKSLADALKQTYGVAVTVPQMQLVDDGHALNRVIRLTQTIQQTVTDILKEHDAAESFKEKYQHIQFVHADGLDVKEEGQTLTIDFPFNDVDAAELNSKDLAVKIYAVL